MTDATEHKQIENIVKRFNRQRGQYIMLFSFSSMLLLLSFYKTRISMKEGAGLIYLLIHFLCLCLMIFWVEAKFARLLSKEERELLVRFPKSLLGLTETQTVVKLLRLSEKSPEKELLRPSQPSQEDILLRAALDNNDASQDQLLRSTTQSPSNPTI